MSTCKTQSTAHKIAALIDPDTETNMYEWLDEVKRKILRLFSILNTLCLWIGH